MKYNITFCTVSHFAQCRTLHSVALCIVYKHTMLIWYLEPVPFMLVCNNLGGEGGATLYTVEGVWFVHLVGKEGER